MNIIINKKKVPIRWLPANRYNGVLYHMYFENGIKYTKDGKTFSNIRNLKHYINNTLLRIREKKLKRLRGI